VRDPIRHISEQKLAASTHANVPDDEHVGVLLFGGAHDAAGDIVVDAEDRARIRECLGVRAQQLFSPVLACGAHVEEDELACETLGELRRPGNRALGGFGPIGGDDDLHSRQGLFQQTVSRGECSGVAGLGAPASSTGRSIQAAVSRVEDSSPGPRLVPMEGGSAILPFGCGISRVLGG